MNDEQRKQRDQALRLVDDDIGRRLRDAEASGELRSAPSWGKPLSCGAGWNETPEELRMPMKILKDAGVIPPEVEALREAAALEVDIAACTDETLRRTLQQRLAEKRQAIALRLEAIARHRSL
jgi:hypothetical protein